jgi:K+-sensing histidine kinase KdpD
VELDLPAGERQDLHVNADPSQFDTALLNLVVNARDAMDGKGRLRIGLRRASRIPAVRAPPPQRGDFIAVLITDTGSGIALENLERIFEPFFSERPRGMKPSRPAGIPRRLGRSRRGIWSATTNGQACRRRHPHEVLACSSTNRPD